MDDGILFIAAWASWLTRMASLQVLIPSGSTHDEEVISGGMKHEELQERQLRPRERFLVLTPDQSDRVWFEEQDGSTARSTHPMQP